MERSPEIGLGVLFVPTADMTDIFFSYSSKDRARIQPLRDALVDRGFSVFWDQEVPTSTDWDTWIRQRLNESKCAIVVWSVNSVVSDNVRHEATIARQHNTIVPVLLDPIAADQFPMGLYTVQAANLCSWSGDAGDGEWLKLLSQVESKLTPAWVRRTLDTLEAELVAERARRETAERRDRTLREQIAKEADARQQLRGDLADAVEQIAQLKVRAEAADRERTTEDPQVTELARQLAAAEGQRQLLAQNGQEAQRKIHDLERALARLERARDKVSSSSTVESTPRNTLLSSASSDSSPASDPSFEGRWAAWQARPESTISKFAILGLVAAAVIALWILLSRAS